MGQPIDTATVQIVPDFSQFSREAKSGVESAMRQLQSEVGSALSAVERDASQAGSALGRDMTIGADRAQVALREVSATARTSMGQVAVSAEAAGNSVGSKLTGVLGGLKTALLGIGLVAGAGLGALTVMGLKSAASLEQTQVAFDSLLGSAAKGKVVFDDLKTFAAVTPFELGDITPLAQKFLAFAPTVGMTTDQLQSFLTTVGNLASVTGGGAESLKSAGLAFSHIASGGKVSLEDINILSDAMAGFSGVAAIATAKGISTGEAMRQISAGEIDAKTGIDALLKGMQDFPGAAGAMEKQSLTLLGVFSTFKDTVGQALSGAFQPVIPAIKDSLTQLTPLLGTALGQLAPALGGILAALLPLIGQLVNAIVPLLTPLLAGLAQMITLIGPALGPLGSALGSIATAIAPVLPIVGTLAATLAGVLGPVIQSLGPIIAALLPLVTAIGKYLGDVLTPLGPVLVIVAKALGDILGPAADLIAGVLGVLAPIVAQLVDAFFRLLSPLLAVIKPLMAILLKALTPLLPVIGQLLEPLVQLVLAFIPLADVLGALLLAVLPIIDPILQLTTLLITFLAQKALVPLVQALAVAITELLKPVELLVQPLADVGHWLSNIDWGATGRAITDALTVAWNAVANFFVGLWDTFTKGVGQAKDIVVTGFNNLVDFVTGLPGKIIDAVSSLPGKLIDFATGIATQAYDLGKNIVLGIINGIGDYIGGVGGKLKDGLSDALNGAKHLLGINSPSSVWADEVGKQIPAGVGQGVAAGMPDIQGLLAGITPNGVGATHANTAPASFGNIIVNVSFSGVVPTQEQARRTGAAAGAGVAEAIARRNVGLSVRTN